MNNCFQTKNYLVTLLVLMFSCGNILAQSTGLIFTEEKILNQVDNAKPRLYGGGSRGQLPASYDLTPLMPPPGNQGQLGSCAGWACAYALKTSHEKVERKWEIVQNNSIVSSRVFSPAFIYNQVNHGEDHGSYFSEVFKLLQEKGCATLAATPYVNGDYLTQPSSKAFTEASNYKIAWAKDIDPKELGTLKSYISQGYPIVIGATVDKAFQNVSPGQVIQSMGSGGGHAMVVVGYNDAKFGGCFKIMNSWGQDWGDGGFCWMTYTAFKGCVNEAWLVEDVVAGQRIDPPLDDDNQPYEEDEDDAEETIEFEDEMEAFISIDSVDRGKIYEGFESYGKGIILSGFIDVDTDAGENAEVVIYFSKVDDEEDIIPCTDDNFSDVNDDLIAYTEAYELEDWMKNQGGEYEVFIPNKLLVASGQKKVLAIPVLFIDGIDVGHGEPIELSVY